MSIRIGIYPKTHAVVPPTPPVGTPLELIFDAIANADAIVGDSSDVADWNTAFGSPASPFTAVVVVGDTVNLYGGADIAVPDSLFSTDIDNFGHLISITDTEGVITSAGYNSFGDYDVGSNGYIFETAILPGLVTAGDGCFSPYGGTGTLTDVNFNALVTAGQNCFEEAFDLISADFPSLITAGQSCFYDCTGLVSPDFSALETAGDDCFYNCTGLVNPNFSVLTTAGRYCFQDCTGFTSISLPSLTAANTSLGTTSGDNRVFDGITGKTITLTVPAYFMTNNGGNPDGDIVYLTTNNYVTVIYV